MLTDKIMKLEEQKQDFVRKSKETSLLAWIIVALFILFYIGGFLYYYLRCKVDSPNVNNSLIADICSIISTIQFYMLPVISIVSVVLLVKLKKLSYRLTV